MDAVFVYCITCAEMPMAEVEKQSGFFLRVTSSFV
jgi:hypothetical protein